MSYVFRTIIVPIALAEQVRNMAIAIIGESVKDMCKVALCNEANEVTHTINTGDVHVDFAGLLSDPAILSEQAGIPLEQAEAILAQADITEDSPETAMERLNLKPFRDEKDLD